MRRLISCIACMLLILGSASAVHAGEDLARIMEEQRKELTKKEEAIRKERQRLKQLEKEVEEDIARYSELLKRVEESLEEASAISSRRLKHVAKAYESMPPENAALRLTGIEEDTAVQILLKMRSKQAGLIIGMMEKKKATELTRKMAKLKKKE